MQYTRLEVIGRLKKSIDNGECIVTAGAGIGLSAKFAERGGADLIVIYNSGRYRMTGFSSWSGYLPIGDANEIVLQMGEREILPVVKEAPVIAGVFASDPTREMDHFLKQVKDLGFSGVTNFPTITLLEGAFRDNMESSGLGFSREVDMVRKAGELDLYTMVYVFTPNQAEEMARAGADCVIAHMGNTAGGSVGQEGGVPPLDDAVIRTKAIAEAALKVNPEIVTLCHGGPIAMPEDAAYVIERTGVHGFVGASSIERLPVEKPLTEATRAFKKIPINISK